MSNLRDSMREQLERELSERAKIRASATVDAEARPPAPMHQAAAPSSLASPVDTLERDVLRLAAAALRLPEECIDANENLANYGIDSIAITEIMASISRFFGVSIAPTTFFEARHLKDLADILRARYGAAIAARTVETAEPPVPPPEPFPRVASAARCSSSLGEPVAIIGMEGMFPQSPDLAAFEANLAQGRDCIEEVPPGRWDWRAVDGDPRRGPYSDVKHGGFVPAHDQFDAAFFNIPPREAELMDPQHRLFIECVWKLIEGAGHAPGSLAGRKIGMFLGINLQDYADLANRAATFEPGQLVGLGHVFCANRLSFLLDITGPSQVVDTACSSSLVAVHRAVQSIRHEGCEMAVAGGANLILTPTQHILFARVGMLGRDGRCKTFSRAADGYGRAEGVGAVLLKRLDLAERDGDTILGVIRGSAENHGGAASSLTAPNPRAQAKLIAEAMRQAGVDPRTIGSIECHGTGTPLGDPVEIEGLKAAFAELHAEHGLASETPPYCGLGSVKSNIGHTETAAGVAGVIKVLLGLRAGRLWQSLHCDEPNPLIDLRGTPFYLLAEPRDWTRPVIDGEEASRCAGISSFGAGGANAHVVIEEYWPTARQSEPAGPQLIVLSARSDTALLEAAVRLAAHLESDAAAEQRLEDIAYTLQVGRDAMRARLALVAHDRADLRRRLRGFASGKVDGLVTGTVERKAAGPGASALPRSTYDEGDLTRLASQWIAGGTIDWAPLHRDRTPRRVPLPTYPFQRKRYWLPPPTTSPSPSRRTHVSDSTRGRSGGGDGSTANVGLHPTPDPLGRGEGPNATCPRGGGDQLALHELASGRFRVQLDPSAFFLSDHVVAGVPTLPGVVYLELIRRAGLACGAVGSLGQVVWLRPLVVKEPVEIEIAVIGATEPQPRVEVARIDAEGTRHLHAQARLLAEIVNVPISHDIAALETAHVRRYDAAHVYAAFDSMGITYGPAHRAIHSLALGTDGEGRTNIFARLRGPDAVDGRDGFALHPSLMDGAFQCALGMAFDQAGVSGEGAALPFALDRLDVFGPCTPDMCVAVHVSAKGEQTGRTRTLDLDLMDGEGRVRVRMQGFATRQLARPERAYAENQVRGETLLFAPEWRPLSGKPGAPRTRFARRSVLLLGHEPAFAAALAEMQSGWSCHAFSYPEPSADAGFARYAQELLARVQEMARGPSPSLLQVVIPERANLLAGLGGLLSSASLEAPGLACQLIAADVDVAALGERLEELVSYENVDHIRLETAASFAARWRKLDRPAAPSPHPWRDDGVYLITGGTGGLGRLFAREISTHAAGVTIVLASRTAADASPVIGLNGARLEHAAIDVTDAQAVAQLVAGIRARHGRLDGVLHAAGLIDDGALTSKTPEGFARVLAPKVAGTCNIDRALGSAPLDLLLLFGSISGAVGNPGQADYAAANAFLDAFAAARERRRRAGLCHGRTLALDWPLWREGGMRLSVAAEQLMTRTTGFVVMNTKAGFGALYDALASGEAQVLAAVGDRTRIEQRLLARAAPAPNPELRATTFDTADLARKILLALNEIVSAQLKVAVADLVPDAELAEYGFDSISFTQLANALNDRFALAITPTLFFEHPTLAGLAAHFARDDASAFAAALGVAARAPAVEPSPIETPRERLRASIAPLAPDAGGRSPIAIIGMSGIFPGADDPEALWRLLLEGRDAVRDVPPGRWHRPPHRAIPARGGFIDGLAEFDAAFFSLSAHEARLMDPQQRLLLSQTWRLMEDAGYAPRRLWGAHIGVFIGIADTGYGRLVAQQGAPAEGYAMTGLAPSVGPNRVSFHYNFTGPSVAVETACSSALVAIHRAAEAIHGGDCTAAIAGGVNALLSPETFEGFASAGMLAADGRSKTFSADADGYGRGEGIGLVFLKRLDEARRDGDRILAVIRGSAENHGGRASSLTAPNPKAQAALLTQAYRRAGFDPRTVTYIETHGTGTPLGDPIEVEALNTAFAALSIDAEVSFGPAAPMACGIGAVKSNIGHLELAAGAAGVIKVLLQMRYGTLARSLHCDTLNPYLKLEKGPFRVVRETTPWTRRRHADGGELPRRAGVSAFGFGGSNAHLVLEEYVPPAPSALAPTQAGPVAIVLSARTEQQLVQSAQRLHDALHRLTDADLASIAFTLQICRDALEHRLAFAAGSIGDMCTRLAAFLAGNAEGSVLTGRVKTHRDVLALLDSDDAVRQALAGLPQRGREDILLQLWVRGLPVEWRALYGANPPARVALPGYPFARTAHWINVAREQQQDQDGGAASSPRVPVEPSTPAAATDAKTLDQSTTGGLDLITRVLDRLTVIAARILETDATALEPDTELGDFGFDSISMTTFAGRVNEDLGLALTPADFFEFATLDRLARHIAAHPSRLAGESREGGIADRCSSPAENGSATPAAVPVVSQQAQIERDAVAIVGLSCCFPGATDADAYWSNLVQGVASIREIPADRWDWRALHGDPKTESNKTNIRFGGFIDGVFEFDPLFFGISPREAGSMDPQQRLMLVHAWKALEDAGHAPRSLAGRAVGLFVGTSSSGYRVLGAETGTEGYVATGTVPSVGPNRISFLLDWHGPSEPVETACSSSLVALHRAVQAIRAGDCDLALAGGVNTIVTPEAHINFAKAGMLSPDGACKTFSRAANGYVRGEGVGMLMLKRLSEAERDGDAIYAVVRGSAINHGGRANSLTAPNTTAQADVIVRALGQAGIDPATVGYVEAHGTGTALGDPVEINALKSAFVALLATARPKSSAAQRCGIGSAKTNIGHLELAAGVAGVAKVLLQLRHRTLAPSLNSEPPNPYIDLAGSPFFIVREAQPWLAFRDASGQELPRRAGVSSFGFGGVNAHVVLEEYADRRTVGAPSGRPVVVPLSARDESRLADQVRQLADYLAHHGADIGIDDLAFTLQQGRTALKHRLAFVVSTVDELKSALARVLAGDLRSAWRGTVGTSTPGPLPADTTPKTAAAHWAQGGEVDWADFDAVPRRRLHLPTYPFAREEYRARSVPQVGGAANASAALPSSTGNLSLDPKAFYLAHHRIAGTPTLPGVMTLELARAACGGTAPRSLEQIVWLRPAHAAVGATVRIVFDPVSAAFRLLGGADGTEVLHAQGRIGSPPGAAAPIDVSQIRARCSRMHSPAWLYDAFAALGLDYGPAFRSVAELVSGRDEVLARLVLPAVAEKAGSELVLHPSMIDGALQACLALYDDAGDGSMAVPFALDRIDVFAPTTSSMWAHIRQHPVTGAVRKIDIDIAGDDGRVYVRIAGFSVRQLPGNVSPRPSEEAARSDGARYLTQLIAAETGVAADQIELTQSLDAYGIDSLMIVRLTDELEKSFGPLPKTLFFEHRTLEEVLRYFLEHHRDRLARVIGVTGVPDTKPAVRPKTERQRDVADASVPIAIVGLAGRYPGARDLAAFWDNLAQGRDCITEVPSDRWDHKRFTAVDRGEGCRWGGFLDGVAEFDPLFFNISPREAPYMDPQERLFLECAFEAIEDAGHTRASLGGDGDVGVFVGVMWEDYQLYGAERTAEGETLALSGSPASIANRVSSVCDFHGPSMAVNSMCSSSLSAIHLACESLALGTCTAAIAGGVNLSLHPNKYVALAQGRFIASSGRCESFGAGGDGYVPGEGVGAVVLKRLDRAIADGDRIYGLIRGSALNHGGKTNGYTVPNPQAQTAVIRRALDKAGVEAGEVSYVEAHGTGTKLGDPIEIAALSAAYRADTPECGFCAIGSIKSNIGHCESAAGIAGLTKVLLQMKHGRLAPSLHAEVLNPGIEFGASPFVVQRRCAAWPRPRIAGEEAPLIAGLSSFGAGGSNAHFIVEEYDAPDATMAFPGPFVFPLSARDDRSLEAVLQRFLSALEVLTDADLPAAAFTLQQGREAFEQRLAVVAATRAELGEKLRAALAGDTPHVHCGRRILGAQAIVDASDVDAVARSWVEGARIDWQHLWPGMRPRRISLPTYPFAREIYWVPGREAPSAHTPAPATAPLPLLFTPDWQPRPATPLRASEPRRLVIVCDTPVSLPTVECHQLGSALDAPHERYAEHAARLLAILQSVSKEPTPTLVQVVTSSGVMEGLGGLLRTAILEQPRLRCQLISLAPAGGLDVAAAIEADAHTADTDIRYHGGRRLVRTWREVDAIATSGPWKDGGVYLITGGTGGLGLHLARHIAASVHQPHLWLASRQPLSDTARATLARLDATITHRALDVTDAAAVTALVADIASSSGRLDGIVHAAGLTRDKLLMRKTAEELRQVLAPKVAGLAALDAATADCTLEFMLLFASASGALGNAGQADYAAANAFMDAFAHERNARVAAGTRYGHTLSIDWPYWRDGGMTLPEPVTAAMQRTTGLAPLETASALAALDAAAAAARAPNLSQILVLDGEQARLRRLLAPDISVVPEPPQAPHPPAAPSTEDVAAATAFLAARIAATLRLPPDRLDDSETFDRYGLDSVSALEIVDTLEAELGPLPKTLLFEYPTLAKLAAALMGTHGPALCAKACPQQPTAAKPAPARRAAQALSAPAAGAETDIAIIAVAGRYPGAETPEHLWQALAEGRDLVTEVPPERWDIEPIYAPAKGAPGKSYCRWGGFLADVDRFDAAFFGISPRDAARMDPQERLFLQTSWHLLERGGYPRHRRQQACASKVGVFVGTMSQQYRVPNADARDRPLLTLASQASLANRVSYVFDLNGPSVAVDSMCSSGLEAVHLACQALRRGECRLAIAGAVNLSIHPDKYVALSETGLIGSHAASRAFAGGDGYLPAEGVGAVLLRPLADALASRDIILGVIKGTAVNHAGRSAGYGVPSADAQRQLIEDNFRAANVDPRSIGYVEAAATGSAMGDAIELRALTRAFKSFTNDEGFCAIGSVKANTGHAEAASGLAQLTKCLFQLKHRTLAPRVSVPGLPTDTALAFAGTPFVLQKELSPWHRSEPDRPLRAAISSFGAGGTNVHLILEEAPPAATELVVTEPGPWRFVLSAATEDQLAAVIAQLADRVAATPDIDLPRLAWTLSACRERLACGAATPAASRQELLQKLAAWPRGWDARDDRHVESADAGHPNDGFGPPLVLPDYPFARARHWLSAAAPRSHEAPAPVAPPPPLGARDLILSALVAETGLPPADIPRRASFRDLGAASMFALRLIRLVADELGVELTHRDLETHDSVHALTALIEGRREVDARTIEETAIEEMAIAQTAVDAVHEAALSQGQLGLWVLQKLYPDMSTYNVPLAFRIAPVDEAALEGACAAVLARYPILARRIVETDATPRPLAQSEVVPLAAVVIPRDADETAVLRQRAALPFDLAAAPPIRFELIRREQDNKSALVLIVIHHIAVDGLSSTLVAHALWDAYADLAAGRKPPPAKVPQPAEFLDYVAFEQAHVASAKGAADLAYWKQRLSGDMPPLEIPADRAPSHLLEASRPVVSASIERRLAPELVQAAANAAKALRVNRPAFFLAALNILLHRYTGAADIVVGMPVLGRPARRFETTVGCFANMIVIRTAVRGRASAASLVAEVQAHMTAGLDHAAYPFAALARELGRTPLDGPLYQVSFAYQNFFDGRPLAGGAEHIAAIRQQGGDAFGIEVFEEADALRLVATYDPARFDAARIERMLDHLTNIVSAIAATPATPVCELAMLSTAERERILGPWASGGMLPETMATALDWIVAEAARRPEATALVAGPVTVTYRALLAEADRLAVRLTAQGVGPGDRVAVLMRRGVSSVVALLGVMRSGGVYVPLDAAQPDARLGSILEDSAVRAVVVDGAGESRLTGIGGAAVRAHRIDRVRTAARQRRKRPPQTLDPSSAAYVIYTSGSTGRPKGVVVSHTALADHCRAMIALYGLVEHDRVLQFSGLGVDASLEQILPALMCGSTVVMRGDDIWSPAQLSEVFGRDRVTVADLPPAYLAEVLRAWEISRHVPKCMPRLLICGGEALTPETVQLWRSGALASARLINAYGPTEATITAITHEVRAADDGPVPIGRPLPGTQVYVLDAYGQPVPEGVPGELFIGGPRLANGYEADERLTAERFVPDAFGAQQGLTPARRKLYRTGDRTAFSPGTNGGLTFLGRLDQQVKVRGFRVELADIEAALGACGAVQSVVVCSRGTLVAFVAEDQARFDGARIAAALAARLPAYMCPTAIIRIDSVPLTAAGKVDRRALEARAPSPPSEDRGDAAAPADATEANVLALWEAVFGAEAHARPLGRTSDFFASGGHSLLAVRLLSGIEHAFGRKLSMADLISAPTVADQARLIGRASAAAAQRLALKLVELRPGPGAAAPLVLVHPVGGDVSCYLALARRLGSDVPVYGIEAPAGCPAADNALAEDLPRRVASYVEAVRALHAAGPYRLAGWSLGGVLAFEMARQLIIAGAEVAPVVLIDSYAPGLLAELEASGGSADGDVLALFARDLLGGRGMAGPFRCRDGREIAAVSDLYRVPELEAVLHGVCRELLQSRFASFRSNVLMARSYRPEPGPVAVRLHIAADGHPDRTRGWGALAAGGLSVVQLPGHHYDLLSGPALVPLVAAIDAGLVSEARERG